MRRLPNDTITLTLPQVSFETLFGDPEFPANAHGGNDTLRVNIDGSLNTVIIDGDAQSNVRPCQGRQRHGDRRQHGLGSQRLHTL
ncbi:hypothetical protein I6F14_33185 [Bradyrhizobium sp. IC3069]|uniref:hypothetical protein n=1 Tax=unclassified Bradyrhizobium TaxID=2631580 RepID=UPI001CD2ECA2|nr:MULTISPECIES: hypothetical protein [unclassified Bradyrhizobium]MCA1365125.1 hypothetical protein [Bradyrhizobium sp. IC4059]MCA1522789.1 hypothetical protein [Bradyrhizobium sp. IC3069]